MGSAPLGVKRPNKSIDTDVLSTSFATLMFAGHFRR